MIRALAFGVALLVAAPALAGPTAPGFRLHTLDGQRIDSRELLGKKVVVLRFQASYCKPCVRESPALARLASRYRDRGVEVIAVHVQDTAVDARAFMRANRVTYPVALDPRLALGNRYGFRGTPFTVVIDKNGEIAARIRGESAVARLPRLLDGLLKPPA